MLFLDPYGGIRREIEDPTDMLFPVECRWCGHVHDSGKVKVLQRHLDCSVWKCPNCGVKIDDRPESLGGSAIPLRR